METNTDTAAEVVTTTTTTQTINPDVVVHLVHALRQAHVLARDTADELEADLAIAEETDRSVGRGTHFAVLAAPEVVAWLEQLGDLLADHFGVPFFDEAPQEDVVRIRLALDGSPEKVAAFFSKCDEIGLEYKVVSA